MPPLKASCKCTNLAPEEPLQSSRSYPAWPAEAIPALAALPALRSEEAEPPRPGRRRPGAAQKGSHVACGGTGGGTGGTGGPGSGGESLPAREQAKLGSPAEPRLLGAPLSSISLGRLAKNEVAPEVFAAQKLGGLTT